MLEIVTDYPLRTDPENVLYKKCDPVVDFSEISSILDEMHHYINRKGAYGIAANQLGLSLRMFSVKWADHFYDYINPEIVHYSHDTEVMDEGCLSYPGLYVKIKRPVSIDLEWTDINQQKQKDTFSGLWGRVIQHEMDHLDGRKFFDLANKYHRDMAFREYKRNMKIKALT